MTAHRKDLFCALLALGGTGLLAAESAMAEEEKTELKVCVSELQPWIYTGDKEHLRGFEVDALADMAEELGLETSFVVKDFVDLKPALMLDECDMIASGYSITLDRVQDISFSVPYNHTEYHLLVPTRTFNRLPDIDAYDDPKMRIGHLKGGVSGQVAEDFFPEAHLVPLNTRFDSLEAFRKGEIDAYVSSDPFDKILNQVAPGEYKIYEDDLLRVSIEAFAVKKGNTELLDKLNPYIIEKVNQNYFHQLHRKWFTEEELLTGY